MANVNTEFVKATNRIAAGVHGIVTLLRLVQEDLKIVREKVLASRDQKPIDSPANKDGHDQPQRVTGSTDKNPAYAEKKSVTTTVPSDQKPFLNPLRKYFSEVKSYVELSTFILLVFYTCETRRTNNLTSDSLITSKQQFALEHRPYLWQVSGMVPGVDTAAKSNVQIVLGKAGGPQVTVATQVENFGQSPAIVTRFAGDVELGGRPGYLKYLSAHKWINFSGVMPTGRVDSFSVQSKETVPAHSHIVGFDATIGALLRIQYTDTEGHLFESDMCIFTPYGISNMSAYCPTELNLTRLIDCQKEACEK
jgi:hypothetical protein